MRVSTGPEAFISRICLQGMIHDHFWSIHNDSRSGDEEKLETPPKYLISNLKISSPEEIDYSFC